MYKDGATIFHRYTISHIFRIKIRLLAIEILRICGNELEFGCLFTGRINLAPQRTLIKS